MPGGGKFKTLLNLYDFPYGVSQANEAGGHAFLATLDDNSSAAYLMGADGALSLILKSGQTTDLGKISSVGQGTGKSFGVGLNTRGEAAVAVSIDNGPDMLVLVGPAAP